MGFGDEAGKLQRGEFWAERFHEIQSEIEPDASPRPEDEDESKQQKKRERRRSVHWGLPAIAEVETGAGEGATSHRSRRASASLALPSRPAIRSSSPNPPALEEALTTRPLTAKGCRLPAIPPPADFVPLSSPRRPAAPVVRAPTAGVPTPRRPRAARSPPPPDRSPPRPARDRDASPDPPSPVSPFSPLSPPARRRIVIVSPPAALPALEVPTPRLSELATSLLADIGLDPRLFSEEAAVPPSPPRGHASPKLAPLSPTLSASPGASPRRASLAPPAPIPEAAARRDPPLPPPKPQLPPEARGRPADASIRRPSGSRSPGDGSVAFSF